MEQFFNYEIQDIQGNKHKMEEYKGKVLLIVNVASRCGFTSQYKGLEKLYKKYKEQGFEILAFPCNQFGAQEPGSDEEIKTFCEMTFHTSFPLFSKIDVNGDNALPLYNYLKKEAPGLLGTQKVKWNFTKFLVNREGEVQKRFAPQDTPESLTSEIESLL